MGEMGVGGGAEGMDSVSSVAALETWVWIGLEGEDGLEVVGVRASSSQESGGGAEVGGGCMERDLRFEWRSVVMVERLVWRIIGLICRMALATVANGPWEKGQGRRRLETCLMNSGKWL